MSPLPAELTVLMTDSITLNPVTLDGDGNPETDQFNNLVFGSPVVVDCYLIRANKRVLDRKGRELVSTVQAILADPDMTVTADDLLTLPDGTQPAIIQVLGAKDEDGNDYYLEVRA